MASIKGTKGNDHLVGTEGFDRISGGRGSDVIDGRGGTDLLKGGKGADFFVLTDPDATATILDFQPGKDRIIIDIDGWDNSAVYYDSIGVLQAGPELGIIAQVTAGTTIPDGDILYF